MLSDKCSRSFHLFVFIVFNFNSLCFWILYHFLSHSLTGLCRWNDNAVTQRVNSNKLRTLCAVFLAYAHKHTRTQTLFNAYEMYARYCCHRQRILFLVCALVLYYVTIIILIFYHICWMFVACEISRIIERTVNECECLQN